MRRSSSFLIGLAAAVITAGTLYAVAGPRSAGMYGYRGWHRGACRWDSADAAQRRTENGAWAVPQATPPDSTARY